MPKGIGENLGNPKAELIRELREQLKRVFVAFYERHVDENDPRTDITYPDKGGITMDKKLLFLILILGILIAEIAAISYASYLGGNLYFVFYQLIYGVFLSVIIPLLYGNFTEKASLREFGIKAPSTRECLITISFIVFSIGGQLINIKIEQISFRLLPMCLIPLIMTTFFEEFLFRGFIQTRIEKTYGCLAAIIVSGSMFSLYHIGYSSFRNMKMLVMLFLVGIMFAISYKISKNNLVVSFFVNLPNAVLTYLVSPDLFPVFDIKVLVISAITLTIIAAIFIVYNKKVCAERQFDEPRVPFSSR